MLHKRPKALDAPIVNQLIRMEAKAYVRADQWRKKYRYTLVTEFRQHITIAKNETIVAFELQARYREEKLYHYNRALAELTMVEANMDVMIMDEIGVMSEKEWAEFAQQIYGIRDGLSRLISSLAKSAGGSESLNLGTESVSAS